MVRSWFGLLAVLGACSQEARLDGQVFDVWGNPVEGATVVMEGQAERPLTDRAGRYSFPWLPGPHKLKAGREGYIQDHLDIEVPEDPAAEGFGAPTFTLYPKPEDAGFYVVGIDEYAKLAPEAVQILGNQDLQTYRGVRFATGRADGPDLRVVFHTPLKMDKVMRLGLTLHRMAYVETARMTSPLAEVDVAVNLWTSAEEVPLEVQPMRSRTDYLLVAKGLKPGTYAIDTQGLLRKSSEDDFHEIPEPWRVAYPFELH